MIRIIWAAAAAAAVAVPSVASAEEDSRPERVQLQPIFEARTRYEHVAQGAIEADALTLRVRGGVEARYGRFSLLAEVEAAIAPVDDYNAFPFAIVDRQRRPRFAAVPDPENAELNRLQLQYRSDRATLTVGRQRINLDDQRWVGSVGWRQNEQTFDAVRAEALAGPVAVDLTYAIGQRTIFGSDADARRAFDGDFVFAGIAAQQGAVQGRLFAYLLDYDEPIFLANSSQTFGGFLTAAIPVAPNRRLTLRASYARQSDHGRNPSQYAADYWSLEAGTTLAGFSIAAGWEHLGSDNGRSVQTPMATLHKFNGWADLFLTTPPNGLQDFHVSLARSFDGVRPLPGLTANVDYHRFGSAVGDIRYGDEWDASLGFRVGPFAALVKFADYDAEGFGEDTRKVWLQLEWSLERPRN